MKTAANMQGMERDEARKAIVHGLGGAAAILVKVEFPTPA